ncbi:MAG: DoxX family protein [Desulfobacterales bacterium]
MKEYDDIGKLLLRVSVLLMLFHGLHKLMYGLAPIEGMLSSHGLPAWLAYGAYAGEIVAPVFIIMGFYARAASFVLALNMFVAILLIGGFFPLHLTKTGGPTIELALLYLLISVTIFLAGPGKYSVNRR